MKTIEIQCVSCKKIVEKSKYEINRQRRKGKDKFYCCLKCVGKENHDHLKKYQNHFKTAKYVRQPDEQSKFRWYIKQIVKNSKKRKLQYDIDIEYLQNLWEKQEGLCPFTKQKLELRTHSYKTISNKPYQASLDRIDNSKGYVKANVRFVALIFNYARNIFTDEQVVTLCKDVVSNI